MVPDYNRKTVLIPAEYIDLEYMTLDELYEKAQELRNKYGGSCIINKTDNEWDSGCSVMVERPETNKEMNLRIKQEEKNEKWREERDKKEFERLKKKFNE